jgi:hypothetical protein
VGVFLAVTQGTTCIRTNGELFVPEAWFAKDAATQAVGLPEEHPFRTKIELGQQMIERTLERCVSFEVFACDTCAVRRTAGEAAPALYSVHRQRPVEHMDLRSKLGWGIPTPKKPMGKGMLLPKVLSAEPSATVAELTICSETVWRTLRVRSTTCGELQGTYSMPSMDAARRTTGVRVVGVPQESSLRISRTH